MLVIDNKETQDDYARDLTMESRFGGRVVYVVANQSAIARFRPLLEHGGSDTAEYGPEILLTPQSSFIDKISGVKFRSAVAGSPARIISQLSEPGDILPASGTPFTATLASSGSVGSQGTPVGVIARATALVDLAADASELTLFSAIIAGGIMETDRMLRLTMDGNYLHNNVAGDTMTLRLKFGGITLIQVADSLNGVTAPDRQPWRIVCQVQNLGANNSQTGSMFGWMPGANAGGIGVGIGTWSANLRNIMAAASPVAVNTAVDQTLEITGQWSAASANDSWRLRNAVLELV